MDPLNPEEAARLIALRDLAATPVIQGIRQRAESVRTAKVRRMVLCIAEQLFDPALDVETLKAESGTRDNSVPIVFHAEVGLPPRAFLTEMRIEAAKRLLHETRLPVWQVARLLGFSSLQVFSRAFGRVVGTPPSRFRRQRLSTARRTRRRRPALAPATLARRAISGRLTAAEAWELIYRLLTLYPPQPNRQRTGSPGGSGRKPENARRP